MYHSAMLVTRVAVMLQAVRLLSNRLRSTEFVRSSASLFF